ncbi:DUF2807 domain-containing protein [Galbibacter sp. EGI 63066]|uniref:head GIN domain-containing protein n=1 Tax=Galbibacter sp. EGI 63066 TaxID=2993559 RepID=UPI002248A444|nr:head GIN domain-containing protein [Galbibacter sp. EGI 63066]MCX2681440.1 DUF2807 domain-containing protein [Galbibacter sp. EGI 63066]
MSTLIKVVIALVISIFLTSCQFDINLSGVKGNGNVVTHQREVDQTFSAIKATEGLDVFVSQGPKTTIKVEADENVIDLIRTQVSNGELHIDCEDPIGNATKKVYVTIPEITALKSSSGAELSSIGTIKGDAITLDASSGSELDVEIQAKDINSESSSGAEIVVYGVANFLEARASSGAEIEAEKLETNSVKAKASSGGRISVHAKEKISISTSSGGDVDYKGDPQVVSKESMF